MAGPLTRSLGRLSAASTAVFVCDVQERFRPVIHGMPAVIDTAGRVARAAEALEMPVLLTEQYPKALGATVPELKAVLQPSTPIIPKTVFSMVVPEVEEFLSNHENVKSVLLMGIEAHVCVLQTTIDLIEKGYDVHVLVDGTSSQRPTDRAAGLARMAQSGAFMTSSESALFQIMGHAKHPAFKAISGLAKEQRPDPLPPISML